MSRVISRLISRPMGRSIGSDASPYMDVPPGTPPVIDIELLDINGEAYLDIFSDALTTDYFT